MDSMELGQYIQEPVALPDGPTYAVGDIHGRFDLMVELMAKLEAHAQRQMGPTIVSPRPRVIFLGDYVDRGPKSYEVLEYLEQMAVMEDAPFDFYFLMGNHEHLMLRGGASGDETWFDTWTFRSGKRNNGGLDTLDSLRRGLGSSAPNTPAGAQQLTKAVMRKCRHFFTRLECAAIANECLFVHAGVNVNRPLHEQRLADVMWVRETFIGREANKTGLRIVHGHTPVAQPTVNEHAINIDTGAFKTGVLTAAFISGPGAEPEFIQAGH